MEIPQNFLGAASVVIDRGETNSKVVCPNETFKRKRSLSPFFKELKRKRDSKTEDSKYSFQDSTTASAESLPIQAVCSGVILATQKRSIPEQSEPYLVENDSQKNDSVHSCNIILSQTSEEKPDTETQKESCNDSQTLSLLASNSTKYYSVLWAKASTRKHKKWEGDGFLYVTGKSIVLKNMTGKTLESSSNYKVDCGETFEDGKVLKLGSKEIEVQELLKIDPLKANNEKEAVDSPKQLTKLPVKLLSRPFVLPCAPRNDEKANTDVAQPMFDPNSPNSLVMPQLEENETVKVVVDPHLSRHLRSHQREGVKFLYKCVMGKYNKGAILADEMGLGKTLQCITLLWTVMKQTPYGRKNVVKRSIIVTPSSLVTNWEKEFNRWLGNERIRVYTVNADHPLKHYPPQCPVLIISYDMATRSDDALKKMKFDLMICDEAHKIKNSSGQAYSLLYGFGCDKRILLTGTPIQNDLMELYSLVDFANPGILGKDYEFRKNFERPIAKFQERNSITSDGQCFEAMQLNLELKQFFLRRSHDVMARYLPPKVTSIVICKPTELQKKLYKTLLSSKFVEAHLKDNCLGSGNTSPLSLILALKKICNHPNLAHPKNQTSDDISVYQELASSFPSGFRNDCSQICHSGKMKILVSLLKVINDRQEKVVLVSHYTKTLGVFEEMCKTFNFKYKRLDGSTQSKSRQQIVDQFNKNSDEFLFLLSSKAGGVGLNLQGASNIILYDIDWNPAHDIQAMARCWRPGQKKETHIYRLLTGGSIEEKMYHRQLTKMDLSGSIMDLLLSNSTVKFSPEELKDIFTFHDVSDRSNTCLTHDLIECECLCDGNNTSKDHCNIENTPPLKKRKSMAAMSDLSKWEHFGPPFSNTLEVGLINAADDLQFIFRSRSSDSHLDSDFPDVETPI